MTTKAETLLGAFQRNLSSLFLSGMHALANGYLLSAIGLSSMLVHVIDVSHPQFEDHLRVVEETLAEIGAGTQRTMLVFNKIDQLKDPAGEVDREHLIEGLRHRFADHEGPVLFLSARTKEGMDSLREVLYAEVRELHVQRFPHNHFLY